MPLGPEERPPVVWQAVAPLRPSSAGRERARARRVVAGWPTTSRGALAGRLGTAALLLLPGALTAYLGFNAGGFFAGTTGLVAVVVVIALVLRVTLAESSFVGVGAPALVVASALGLLAVWALVSSAWSDAPSRALLEFDRALLYLLIVVLVASMPRRSSRLRWMVRGVAAGTVVVCVPALISRTLPHTWPVAPHLLAGRLSYPVTYWNALGLLAALGIVLSLHLASDEREPWAARALGAAALPALSSTLLLTFSRGAIGVAILGVLAYALVARPRGLPATLVTAGPATAIGVLVTYHADLLGTPDYRSHAAISQGRHVMLAVVLCSAAALVGRALLAPLDRRIAALHLPPRLRLPVIGASSALAAIAVVSLALGLHAPRYASQQFDRFVHGAPIAAKTSRERLLDPANNGRLPLWRASLRSFRGEPFHGTGAGTFQVIWTRDRRARFAAVDGHSLYLEVLGELGIVGLALVLVAVLGLLTRIAWLARGRNRALYGALFAASLVWAVHAGIDWDWEMPAVTLPVLALGAAALTGRRPRLASPSRTVRVFGAAGLLVVGITPALIAISQRRLDASVHAFRRGDCATAVDRALASTSVLAVRPEPFEILGYCDARTLGFRRLGVRMMQQAVQRDPDNWEFRYGLAVARGAARLDPRPAARAAYRLNRPEPLARNAVRRFATADPREWQKRARAAPVPYLR